MDKLFSALSLCKKAGALVTGFEAVREALVSTEAKLLLLAADASPGTQKRIKAAAPDALPVLQLPYTQDAIAAITRKRVGVMAVTNQDLAALVRKSESEAPAAEEEPV